MSEALWIVFLGVVAALIGARGVANERHGRDRPERRMSRFLDPLKVVLLTPAAAEYRGHWALKAKLRYQSDLLGRVVTVPRGFVTDMESCPRLPVVFLAFGEVSKMAAVIHDYLYTHPTTCTRAEADAVLREACRVEGVSAWRAWGIWAGVRIGGAGSFGEQPR